MKHIQRLVYPLIFLLLLSACNKKLFKKAPENFDAFYEQFHEDSAFQMKRITFPLEGRYVDIEGEKKWSRQDWEMHRQKVTAISEPDYDTEIIRKDDVVIDKVKLKDSGFYVERRFELKKGKWYLVYYESVNL